MAKQTGFPIRYMTTETLNDITDYARENGHRFFTITFDAMNGLYFDSPSIPLSSWVYLRFGLAREEAA